MSELATVGQGRPRPAPEAGPAPDPWPGRIADLGLLAGFLALAFLLGVFPLKDTDFWWHLRTGDLIRQAGRVPTADTYTFGAEGHRWTDLHWIFQVLLSHGYERFGVPGLNLAKCAITALAVGLLVNARRRDWPVWAMVLAWLPALLVLAGRMYIRPETLTLLYLAAYLAILPRVVERPWLALLLPLVQLVWVNSQGLFIFGPVVLGAAWLGWLVRPGAFGAGSRRWWGIVGAATALVGVACFVNPYGYRGAFYPLELFFGTMADPVFSKTIMELEPLSSFMAKTRLENVPLRIHLATVGLGLLSFLFPIAWRVWDRSTRPSVDEPPPPKKGKRRSKQAPTVAARPDYGPLLFRLALFGVFTWLGFQASRNSHQFAAVVGTVTAWNVGEWGAEIGRRRGRGPGVGGRVVACGAVLGLLVATASGALYEWEGEGRTVGLGEEPHWFPHAAVEFAGRPDMPRRSVCFHNGHAALYEYRHAPDRKTYADARLEVVGPDLYKKYDELGRKIGRNEPGWEAELDALGRPLVLTDNVHASSAGWTATMLASPRYRCVWFDEVAAMFVHEAYTGAAQAHAVDLAARHFDRTAPPATDPAAEVMRAKTCWNLVLSLGPGSGGPPRSNARTLTRDLTWLGLDHARAARRLDPAGLDGWKWGGMLLAMPELAAGDEPIQRFRRTFDPVFDLNPARATYDLRRARQIAPEDGNVLSSLASLDGQRGLYELAVAELDDYIASPKTKMDARERGDREAMARSQRDKLAKRLGVAPPSLKWANLAELDRLVSTLSDQGRAEAAADLLASAYPAESRPWEVSDRIAAFFLQIGNPDDAARAWLDAKSPPAESVRLARVAAARFVRGDLGAARDSYQSAVKAEPGLFEAQYGLAVLEAADGHAPESLAAARIALLVAPHSAARSALQGLIQAVGPYAKP